MILVFIKSTIILMTAAFAAWMCRRQSAALKHAIWTAGLIGALAVPMCGLLLPVWRVPAPIDTIPVLEELPLPAAPAFSEVSAAKVAKSMPAHSAASTPWRLGRIVVLVWIGGAAIGLAIMFSGAAALAFVAIRAERLDDSRWATMSAEIASSLNMKRRAQLLQNRAASLLGTWGLVRPRVLVPSNAEHWTDERVRMVLRHELAHVKRNDWAVQVLAEAARAIYWFNPVFWIAYSRLRRESEVACDDTVLRLGVTGARYAEELLELTRTLRAARKSRSPVLAMAQPSHLEQRLKALLNPSLNRLAAAPWAILAVAAVAVCLTLPLATLRGPAQPPALAAPETLAVATRQAPPSESPQQEQRNPSPPPKQHLIQAAPVEASISETPSTREASTTAVPPPPIEEPQPPQPVPAAIVAAATPATEPARPSFACPVTPTIKETPRLFTKTEPLGPGPWHVNANRTIWVWDQPYAARKPSKTMWVRPADTDLVVTGRRLDGNAPPLEVGVPGRFSTGYLATEIIFPERGCWEVSATAGSENLVFVIRVDSEDANR